MANGNGTTPSGSEVTWLPGHIDVLLTDFVRTAKILQVCLMNIASKLGLEKEPIDNCSSGNVIDEVYFYNSASLEIAGEIFTVIGKDK